uniref:Uncharacterized protein n=1 Tax=Meloidogyne incognita TaxID=6306 RepID=A0A914L3P3_MELIC
MKFSFKKFYFSYRSLDISQSDRTNGHYTRPVTSLHTLITSLPNLVSLDISGTNLTSASSDNDRPFIGRGIINSDIPALCFLRRPLKFLGIFNCDSSSQYANIPAERISGEHGEDQVLTAMEVYLERPKTMHTVLNESYQLYRFGTDLHRYVDALHLVLRALKMHLGNKDLQIAGSASMFYIIRHVKMNRDTKRRVILALLDGMESHLEEQVMVRNCCLSLCQFDIPQEILFNYGRVANLLVKVLETHNSDVLTQRIVVFLLNSMACHVEGEQKVEVGEIGAIEIILKQIERKLSANTCDDVMEVGWSFLWNITDETPSNCERFLKAHGLSLFSKCFSRFGSRYFELVRNMMGLIGNIAEVFELRNQLMTNAYLEIFCHLLDNLTESIEISYNSAGVLAHLVSDGDERWAESGVNIPREDVNRKIVKATEKWDLQARRFINYRSFKPIICLLPQWHSEGAQQWAVWALANLTTTDRKKYCRFIIDEGGLELLENLSVDARSTEAIKNLANIVLRNIDEWKRNIIEVNEEDLEMVSDAVGFHDPTECLLNNKEALRKRSEAPRLIAVLSTKDSESANSVAQALKPYNLPIAAFSSSSAQALLDQGVTGFISTAPFLFDYVQTLVELLKLIGNSNLVSIVDNNEDSSITDKFIAIIRQLNISISEIISVDHPNIINILNHSDAQIIPTQEQQPPPNPIKEVFIDESVEEEEENEQEKPKVNILFISAGVLAHIVSDGDERWAESGVNIPREDVNRKIVKATEKWDLQARRFINYRSFKPIICLLPQWHSEGAQQWAVWALANLTTTDRKKYCRFIIDEGGLELLENLSIDARSTEAIKNLANIVLRNIDEWKRNIIEVNEEDLEMVDD